MGVVYQAPQLSLGRPVAVKVLPVAAAFDPRHLQRFLNETQAAAQLHHTNIVPVYAVGCERGVRFYAMQLIEGQGLNEVIRELRGLNRTAAPRGEESRNGDVDAGVAPFVRQSESGARGQTSVRIHRRSIQSPNSEVTGSGSVGASTATENPTSLRASKRSEFFRTVARLALQAAEALEYAHQLGVVHRDIKPANLMLDVRGNLWITDFGLAQFHDDDAGLTRSGDILGTLRYMSPEQAGGKEGVIDHRTDVYSLGVTFYELLTLERALPGDTRKQLLHQIDSLDPRPARSIDRTIPPELETILIKATAKEPGERYASAGALAEDLRRFLRDEPILARPPSAWDKAIKWTRRHRTLTLSAVAMLVLTTVGLLASTVLIAREQSRTHDALLRERQQAREADRSFRQARDAVDFFTRVASEEMDQPQLADVRIKLLEAALAYYQQFIEQHKDDHTTGAELAESRSRVSSILSELAALRQFFSVTARSELLPFAAVRQALGLRSTATEDGSAEFVPGSWTRFLRPDEDVFQMKGNEKQEILTRVAGEIEAELNKVLTPRQAERLRQIARQLSGAAAFSDPEVLKALSLTPAQEARMRMIQDRYHVPRFMPGRWGTALGSDQRRNEEAVQEILDLLTPSQASPWYELTGEPFTGRLFLPDNRRPPGQGPGFRNSSGR